MQGRIRLLVTASEFVRGSQTRDTFNLVSKLDRDLFDIHIGVLAPGDDALPEVKELGLPCFQLRLQPSRSLSPRKIAAFASGPFKLINKRYDVVHSLLYQSFFTEALLTKALTGAKYVYVKSNLEWDSHPLNWRLKTKMADKVVCLSTACMDLLAEHGFSSKCELVFNGVDTTLFSFSAEKRNALRHSLGLSEDTFIFGCAAQFIASKDHPTLVRAFGRIADRHADAVLLLCGADHGDSYYDAVLEEIKSVGDARRRIVLLGAIQDMPDFYSAIDCFVLPTRKESFGNVFTEAMSCGKPAISGRTGGPMEIIRHGETGYLIDLGSVEDLASKMESYLTNPDLAREHGTKGRQVMEEQFSLQRFAQRMQQVYLSVLGRESV
jgi:glycosyltransferase involved in cell wall biosynthesis